MMVKKIGKFFLLLNLFLNICADDFNLVLKAIDFENIQISEVAIGVPFLMNLVIESAQNFNDVQQAPLIEKLENGTIKEVGLSTTIKTINGRTTIIKTYQYEVRIDKEGFYHIGPVKIQINGHTYQSNILKLNVVKEITNKRNKSENVILKLSIDKPVLFVHEQAKLSIKFYYEDEQVRLLNVEAPDLKDFSCETFELVASGNEQINNKQYMYQEFTANIYPKKTGSLLIPSVAAFYEESKNNLNLFMNFFNQTQHKKINSLALKVDVSPLPKSLERVDVVGKFNKFTSSVNQNIATEGEGIVLKLELEGQGDFNNINLNKLNLPEEFKYYDSTHNVKKMGNGIQVKTFEYILQSSQSGEFAIPAQEFNYFDIQTQTYKKLYTKPITIQVQPLPESSVIEQKEEEILIKPEDMVKSIDDNFKPNKKEKFIGLKLFLFLLFFPIFINLIFVFKKYRLKNYKKDFLKLLEDKSITNLHQIFIEYFAAKFNVSEGLVTQTFIEDKLKSYDVSQELISKWNLFFVKLNELNYGKNQKINYVSLQEEAKVWITIFNEKLKS